MNPGILLVILDLKRRIHDIFNAGKYMLGQRVKGNYASAIIILLIFIGALLIAAVGAFVADYLYVSGFLDFTLIIIDLFILVIAITTASFLAQKIGTSVSNDEKIAHRQVVAVLLCLGGILVGLGTWTQLGGSPKLSIFVPIGIASAMQLVLYLFASIFIFVNSDVVRKKVWTPIMFFLMLTAPSLILYASRL